MNHTLLAKENVTLKEHLYDTLNKANEIIEGYNVEPLIRKTTLLSAALHDVGKADSRFQKAIKEKTRPKVSHALLTLGFVGKIIKENIDPPHDALSIIAIASHHSPITRTLFMEYSPDDAFPYINDAKIFELQMILIDLFKSINIQKASPRIERENSLKFFLEAKEKLAGLTYTEKKKLREDLIFIQGVLLQADWLASSRKEKTLLCYPAELVMTNKKREDLNRFQKLASLIEGDIFITLPTGFGKTETSLFWARSNGGKRLFYILPTRTTINAMHKRLRAIWRDMNEDLVGLWHSRAEFYILAEKIKEENIEGLRSDLLMYKYYFNPVNVTTPDQLILSLMNYKRYTLKSFPLKDSLVIIDEIHVYDEETLGLIKGLIKHLKEHYNVRFCIMSATLPYEIKKQFSFLNAENLLPEEELKNLYQSISRTKMVVFQHDIFQAIPDIIQEVKKKHKVLVVLNTVARAQKFHKDLKNELLREYGKIDDGVIMLLHSRFTQADRIKKEEILVRRESYPQILVSTQVVNVSLDIDYDVLYTESCYPDELYQRAGRINRSSLGRVQKPVYVFKPLDHLPYSKELMERAWDFISSYSEKIDSELDYIELAEDFYKEAFNQELIEDGECRYEIIWRNMDILYSIDLSDKEVQKLLKTRSGFINVPAYPKTLLEKVVELQDRYKDTTSEIERYKIMIQLMEMLVDVPLNYKTADILKQLNGYWIVDATYDSEFGLLMEGDEAHESII
ncbi:MAG: CRISPR-associated helicase Cas3' [Nitrososphaerota archaeon]|uniref:CRISPR-associated helicase Cas3' n=1 Tax=Saccharolobus sp. TaxID=2100761 RepID=UPI00317BF530